MTTNSVFPLTNPASSWSTALASYPERVGRIRSHSAERLLTIADERRSFSPSASYVLDNGAGTGTLTDCLTSSYPGIRVLATDIAPGMLEALDAKQIPNVKAKVMDATNLDNSEGLGPDGSLSHAFSTFMIMFTTQSLNVLNEMHRVLQPGGIIGLAIWGERVGPNTLWEEACQLLDPTYTLPAPFADPHAWRTERESEGALQEVGFKEVHTEVYKVPFEFEDMASYMRF